MSRVIQVFRKGTLTDVRIFLTHVTIVSLLTGLIVLWVSIPIWAYINANWQFLANGSGRYSHFWIVRAAIILDIFPAPLITLGIFTGSAAIVLFIANQIKAKLTAIAVNVALAAFVLTMLLATGNLQNISNALLQHHHEIWVLRHHGFFQPQASAIAGVIALTSTLTALSYHFLARISETIKANIMKLIAVFERRASSHLTQN
jgi:hypothetical protein